MTYRADYLLTPPAGPRFDVPETVNGQHWVYFHLAADNTVLYIGRTCQPMQRTVAHESSAAWFNDIEQFIWFGPMDEINVKAVERELIAAVQPPNNSLHTERSVTPAMRLSRAQRRVKTLRSDLQDAERWLARCEAWYGRSDSADGTA